MAKKQINYVETFFNVYDAHNWVYDILMSTVDSETDLIRYEVIQTEGGGYRAGIQFADKQLEFFGAEEDA